MDNEQKHVIALDSEIDINSNDMLVPVGSPKFSFNRQRFLGNVLQNSVRYEADGWFAGWWVHNFDAITTGTINVTPDLGNVQIQKLYIPGSESDFFYNINFKDIDLVFNVSFSQFMQWTVGNGSVTRLNDQVVQVMGTTSAGVQFTVDIDAYNGNILSFVCTDPDLVPTCLFINGTFNLVVEKPYVLGSNMAWVRFGKDAYTPEEVMLRYSYNGTIHKWGDLFTYDGTNVVSLNPDYKLDSFAQINPNTLTEYFEVNTHFDALFTLVNTLKVTAYAMYDKFKSKSNTHPLRRGIIYDNRSTMFDYTDPLFQCNFEQCTVFSIDIAESPYASATLEWHFPVWFKHHGQLNFESYINITSYNESSDDDGNDTSDYDYNAYIKVFGLLEKTFLYQNVKELKDTVRWAITINGTTIDVDESTEEDILAISGNVSASGGEVDVPINISCYNVVGDTDFPADFDARYFSYNMTLKLILPSASDVAEEVPIQLQVVVPTGNVSINAQPGPTLNVTCQADDPFLFNGTVGPSDHVEWNMTVPLCTYAYTYYKVETVDILASKIQPKIESFAIRTLSNTEVNVKKWRMDDNGGDIQDYALEGVMPRVASIQQDTSGSMLPPINNDTRDFILSIDYENQLAEKYVFDRLVYPTNEDHLSMFEYDRGVYPAWIAPSIIGLHYFRPYIDFDVQITTTGEKLTGTMRFFEFIDPNNDCAKEVAPNIPATIHVRDAILTGKIIQNDPITINVFTQHVRLELDGNGNYVNFDYNVKTQTISNIVPSTPDYTFNSMSLKITLDTTSHKNKYELTTKFAAVIRQQFRLERCLFIDRTGLMSAVQIVAANAAEVTFSPGYGTLNITGAYEGNTAVQLYLVETGQDNDVKVHVNVSSRAVLYYVPLGIWWRNKNVIYKSISGNRVTFEYDGIEYVITIGNDFKSELVFSTRDIRTGEYKDLWHSDTADIIMAVKQFWSSTVDTENFWWIDADHVLELSKHDLILHEKMKDANGRYLLHDWNGDRWTPIKQIRKAKFFENRDLYYGVTAAYKQRPVLLKLTNMGSYIAVKYIDNILTCDFANPVWQQVNIGISKLDYPSRLSTNNISSFMPLDINSMICSGKISTTCIGNDILIGIALGRGLQQWTIQINRTTRAFKIINCYGHVGHTGNLTGGQIPDMFCDSTGFNGTVTNINTFESAGSAKEGDHRVSGPTGQIYGSGSSIWFVFSDINGIVSHLRYNNGTFIKEVIPLSNNYSLFYAYQVHKCCYMYDSLPQALTLLQLLGLGGVQDSNNQGATDILQYLVGVSLPSVWFMAPYVVLGGGIIAMLEQSAYVIRNHLPVKSDDGKSDKDLSIARFKLDLVSSTEIGKISTIFTFLMSIIGALTQAIDEKLMISPQQGTQTTDDTIGRKLGESALIAASTNLNQSAMSSGVIISLKATIRETLNLSMFYSIDDNCECWAGPGFVNHNFIGQCVAQGINTTRLKLERFGVWLPLEFLTRLINWAQLYLLKLAQKGVQTLIDLTQGDSPYAAGSGPGSIPQIVIGGILAVTLVTIDAAIIALQWLEDSGIDSLYKVVGNTVRGYYPGGVSKNNVDPEATHTYGNKHMSMFWPAFGCEPSKPQNSITVERVQSRLTGSGQLFSLAGHLIEIRLLYGEEIASANFYENNGFFITGGGFNFAFSTQFKYIENRTLASSYSAQLPQGMACVEGVTNMLPTDNAFKNLQVNCCDYTFPPPPIHDYQLTANFGGIGVQAANGEIIAYSADDIKLIDGPASNIIELDSFFGISSSYTAIEIKNVFDPDYLRPWAVTPTCIALNINRFNCVQNNKVYHGFDGQFNRIVSWKGGTGLDVATMVQQYCLQVNDHFKRSNIIPPSEFFGLFNSVPSVNMRSLGTDKIANQVMDLTRQKGLDINIPGEDRDLTRYSLPIHSESLSTLPAMCRILAPYKLHVVEGITSLTTDVRNTQTKYKAPSSVDFNIYGKPFRATEEYVCSITLQDGVVAIDTDSAAPSSGLTFIGATTKEAFFYSPATRMYYSFTGGQDINKKDILNRFIEVKDGRWDFVNQEVMFKALLNDNILGNDVEGYVNLRLDGNVKGEVYPANETLYNRRSDYKLLSMPGGFVYQGPKRCAINRFITLDHMIPDIQRNKRRWKKLDREDWPRQRDYEWHYDDFRTSARFDAVFGWTHNPWRAATAMLGIDEETDCLFEWELTFAWTDIMHKLFEQNEFVSFNCAGETIGQGGTLLARPTHIFLYKELFKNGYYTMRYQSKNGIGNRERLYMWGDGISALEGLALYTKDITKRRVQPIATSQVDVQELREQ